MTRHMTCCWQYDMFAGTGHFLVRVSQQLILLNADNVHYVKWIRS